MINFPGWLALAGVVLVTGESPRLLFDFRQPESAGQWQTVNDGVMGGVSNGAFRITPANTLEFTGVLSLANNGGFASVRSRPRGLGLKAGDCIVARIRGDGREYSLNIYTSRPLRAFSHRAFVATKKAEWLEVRVPLEKFVAISFGQVVPNARPLDPAEVNGLGFLLGDKKPGPFQLEIDWLRAEGQSGR